MMIAHVFSLRNPQYDFAFISVYIDDLNIICNEHNINKLCHHLKTEIEMKYLGQPNFDWVYNWSVFILEFFYTKLLVSRKCWGNSIWTK